MEGLEYDRFAASARRAVWAWADGNAKACCWAPFWLCREARWAWSKANGLAAREFAWDWEAECGGRGVRGRVQARWREAARARRVARVKSFSASLSSVPFAGTGAIGVGSSLVLFVSVELLESEVEIEAPPSPRGRVGKAVGTLTLTGMHDRRGTLVLVSDVFVCMCAFALSVSTIKVDFEAGGSVSMSVINSFGVDP